METHPAHALMVHGSILLLCGLLSGIPFWMAIIRGKSDATIRAWRVAHGTLIACGLILLVVALISPYLVLIAGWRALLTWSLIVSGYSFAFALIAGAATGRRALVPGRSGLTTLLFAGHLAGAVGAILGIGIVLYGLCGK